MASTRRRTRREQAEAAKDSKLAHVDRIKELFDSILLVADRQELWVESVKEPLQVFKILVIDNPDLRKELLGVLGNDRDSWADLAREVVRMATGEDVESEIEALWQLDGIQHCVTAANKIAQAGNAIAFKSKLEGDGISRFQVEKSLYLLFIIVGNFIDDANGYFADKLGAPEPPMHASAQSKWHGGRKKLKRADRKTNAGGRTTDSEDDAPQNPSRQSRPERKRKRALDSDDEAENSPTTQHKRLQVDEE